MTEATPSSRSALLGSLLKTAHRDLTAYTAVGLAAAAADRVKENGHEVPEDLKAAHAGAERELAHRLREDKARRLRILKTRREGLLTRDEKLAKVDAEITALEAELGQAP